MFFQKNELVEKYGANPLYNYEIETPDHIYEEGNEICSDYMKVFLKIGQDKTFQEISYTGLVMNYHLASASIIIKEMLGKNIEEIFNCQANFLINLGLDVKKTRYKNILFPLKAIRNAVHSYLKDEGKDEIVDLLE